jgi:hypothetical protein
MTSIHLRHPALAAVLATTLTLAAAPTFAQEYKAGRFDSGKMWTFEYAPTDYFAETYGFDANDAW